MQLQKTMAEMVIKETDQLFEHAALFSYEYENVENADMFRIRLNEIADLAKKDTEEKTSRRMMILLPCEEESYALQETAGVLLKVLATCGNDFIQSHPDLVRAKKDLSLLISAVAFCCPNCEPSWWGDRDKQMHARDWWTGEVLN